MRSKILSICVSAITDKASETVSLQSLLHSGKMNRSDHISVLMVENMSHMTKILSFIKVNNILQIQQLAPTSQFYGDIHLGDYP
jgi:hypothetical protein